MGHHAVPPTGQRDERQDVGEQKTRPTKWPDKRRGQGDEKWSETGGKEDDERASFRIFKNGDRLARIDRVAQNPPGVRRAEVVERIEDRAKSLQPWRN